MKSVLVTGAGGYIGVPTCELLLDNGYRVVAVDRFFFGQDKIASLADHPNFEVVVDDLRSLDARALSNVDAVIDMAGLSNDASADIDPKLTMQINSEGGSSLARSAKEAGIRRYVYSSSASVYGAGTKEHLTETDDCKPQTEYARSKLGVEATLHELADSTFEPVILRNATVFGLAPRMRFDLAINIMTLRAWRDRVIYIMGGGDQWRPFVHVNDVARALLLALEAPAEKVADETFNVGSTEMNFQIKQLAQFVIDVIPNVTLHNIPDDPDRRSYNLSFDKVSEVLGFQPSVRIHEGIVEIKQALERGEVDGSDPTCYTVSWYKAIIEWSERLKSLAHNGVIL
jgi:nucleoside-diphosphate-sugar epimerase